LLFLLLRGVLSGLSEVFEWREPGLQFETQFLQQCLSGVRRLQLVLREIRSNRAITSDDDDSEYANTSIACMSAIARAKSDRAQDSSYLSVGISDPYKE
jgi:hypothetical protein